MPDAALHLGARCTAIEECADQVRVRFADGRTAAADLAAFAPTTPAVEESWRATATTAEFPAEFEHWHPPAIGLIRAGGDMTRP